MTDPLLREVVRTLMEAMDHHQPSLEFTRLSQKPVKVEIYRDYRMPAGIRDPRHLELLARELWDEMDDFIDEIDHLDDVAFRQELRSSDPVEGLHQLFDDVIVLNPELRGIRFPSQPDLGTVYGVLLGVSSGFTPQDIDFFLHDWDSVGSDPEWEQKWDKVLELYGIPDRYRGGWIPSHGTLDELIADA